MTPLIPHPHLQNLIVNQANPPSYLSFPCGGLHLGSPQWYRLSKVFVVFFHKGSTSSFVELQDNAVCQELEFDNPSSRIQAPVDSSQAISEPMPMLRLDGPFFVIEAASRHQRFGWAKKANLRYFYTKTWPFSEVLQVYATPP